MLSVSIVLHGFLNQFATNRSRDLQMTLQDGAAVAQLLDQAGVPAGLLSQVVVNGRTVGLEDRLSPADVVEAFPFCGGG